MNDPVNMRIGRKRAFAVSPAAIKEEKESDLIDLDHKPEPELMYEIIDNKIVSVIDSDR